MDKIPTKEEFLKKKEDREREKLELKKEEVISRVIRELQKGNTHMLGVPNDDEVLSHVTRELEAAGWKVEVSKEELTQTNVRTHKEYKRINVHLKFS